MNEYYYFDTEQRNPNMYILSRNASVGVIDNESLSDLLVLSIVDYFHLR